jgi:hypothetical protein
LGKSHQSAEASRAIKNEKTRRSITSIFFIN